MLDPFCGSGTTLDSAEMLGRKWMGIDASTPSIEAIISRLKSRFGFIPNDHYTLKEHFIEVVEEEPQTEVKSEVVEEEQEKEDEVQ